MFLLDTNVVSEFRRVRPHPRVVAWVAAQAEGSLRVSAVTLGEIQAGVELMRPREAAKALEIEAWADALGETLEVLAADAAIFRQHAKLMPGKTPALYVDALIAATAIVHDLTIATRNLADFGTFGVRLFNPFAA